MATQAGTTGRDGVMGDGRIVQQLLDSVVTIQTQLRRCGAEELVVIRAVRVVASTARAVGDRRVHVIALLKRYTMTSRTEFSIRIDAE